MAVERIPVDLANPGQVFASLGFLEAADLLLGQAEGGFRLDEGPGAIFELATGGDENPFACVLEFLANCDARAFAYLGFESGSMGSEQDGPDDQGGEDDEEETDEPNVLVQSEVFPARSCEATALPVRLSAGERAIELAHWCDGSDRETFKLYSGNRSAEKIARAMLRGTREKLKKGQTLGTPKTKGVVQLWHERREELIARPFDILTPMGGSFNFDPRGGWTAIDAGYSPNEHKHTVAASPVAEILAAWGLQHTRPVTSPVRNVAYAVWHGRLDVGLARVAFQCGLPWLQKRAFHFTLALSGKNKVVTFANEGDLP